MADDELGLMRKKIEELAESMQRAGFYDYIAYLSNSRRIIIVNFLAGLTRGLGIAVGFTLLGALVVYVLQKAAYQNLPVIGDFISEIVKIVQARTGGI
ncbi:MAG TPA: DUF5665 domain-containing protein [Clostridia bacterium]|nr:DUF5665 domain-containing protein [Clostridia bacterium]